MPIKAFPDGHIRIFSDRSLPPNKILKLRITIWYSRKQKSRISRYLTPNCVENAGFSVIKPQKRVEKGFQLITLDDLLRKEPVEKAFTPDGALYLRLVLTDQRSLNIRNELCHGILPPDSFGSGVAARLLHVLVMIGWVRIKITE